MIINYLEMNPTSFSKAIGIGNNVTIGRIIKDKKTPSFDVLEKIAQQYCSIISMEWLIAGRGNMLIKDNPKSGHKNDIKYVPGECQECIAKERLIHLLEDSIANQKTTIKTQERLIQSLDPGYKQTSSG